MDTSPSLNFLTQNAIFAADMIFSPCPQRSLDLASLSQFWAIFSELADAGKNPDETPNENGTPKQHSAPAIAVMEFLKEKNMIWWRCLCR